MVKNSNVIFFNSVSGNVELSYGRYFHCFIINISKLINFSIFYLLVKKMQFSCKHASVIFVFMFCFRESL